MAIDQDNKSRPRYRPLVRDRLGRHHLLLCDAATVPPTSLSDAAEFATMETWAAETAQFPTTTDLLGALPTRLSAETIGLRLYAVGTESFLWDVAAVARRAGMGAGEVFLCHAGGRARRVRCVHCQTLLDDVTMSLVDCTGCGATLFVRDHFSARLAAFMGVKVDAELPGELPDAEAL